MLLAHCGFCLRRAVRVAWRQIYAILNRKAHFEAAFKSKGPQAALERMERNEAIFSQMVGNEALREAALEWMMTGVYSTSESAPMWPKIEPHYFCYLTGPRIRTLFHRV